MTDYLSKRHGNRNPYFEAMLKEGTNTSPIGAHSQGMSRLAFALLAGLERGQMDREERDYREKMAQAMWNGGQPQQGAQGSIPLRRPVAAGTPSTGDQTAPASTSPIPLPRPRPA